MNLPVELVVAGKLVRAVSQDLSPYGMFVRMAQPVPVGTVVQVVLAPNRERHVTHGQVTHVLGEVEARTLGRSPGIGVVFREPMRPSASSAVMAVPTS